MAVKDSFKTFAKRKSISSLNLLIEIFRSTSAIMAEGEAAGGPHKANEKVHVIHTGNLYKSLKSRLLAKPKLRYVILTNSGIHWFKRDEDG